MARLNRAPAAIMNPGTPALPAARRMLPAIMVRVNSTAPG